MHCLARCISRSRWSPSTTILAACQRDTQAPSCTPPRAVIALACQAQPAPAVRLCQSAARLAEQRCSFVGQIAAPVGHLGCYWAVRAVRVGPRSASCAQVVIKACRILGILRVCTQVQGRDRGTGNRSTTALSGNVLAACAWHRRSMCWRHWAAHNACVYRRPYASNAAAADTSCACGTSSTAPAALLACSPVSEPAAAAARALMRADRSAPLLPRGLPSASCEG